MEKSGSKKFVNFIFFVFLISILLFTGCASGIPESRLSYFKGLIGQKFWTDKPLSVDVEKDDTQKITLFTDIKEGAFEGIRFDEVKITETLKNGAPQKGYISAKIINNGGEELSSYNIAINKNNESTIKNLISQMETNQKKVTDESKELINKGNFNLAIFKLNSIQRTDEVKSLLDSAYYGMANNDFEAGNYNKAVSNLSNIKYDNDLIQKGAELQSKAQQCEQLLADAQGLINEAKYSQARDKLSQLQQINNSQAVQDLLTEISDPWLLDASQIKEAIAYGKSRKNEDYFTLMKPWAVNTFNITWKYSDGIIIVTPYLQVAYTSYDNARNYKETTFEEALESINALNQRLKIIACIFGDKIDFADYVNAVIKIGDKAIQPVDTAKLKLAEPTPAWPYSPSYMALNVYEFDLKNIPRNAKFQFIIIFLNNEKRINVDLSKIK